MRPLQGHFLWNVPISVGASPYPNIFDPFRVFHLTSYIFLLPSYILQPFSKLFILFREATEVFRVATECGCGLTKGSESPLTTEASDARISFPEPSKQREP